MHHENCIVLRSGDPKLYRPTAPLFATVPQHRDPRQLGRLHCFRRAVAAAAVYQQDLDWQGAPRGALQPPKGQHDPRSLVPGRNHHADAVQTPRRRRRRRQAGQDPPQSPEAKQRTGNERAHIHEDEDGDPEGCPPQHRCCFQRCENGGKSEVPKSFGAMKIRIRREIFRGFRGFPSAPD
eukprot:scaffold889_cov268-Pinguiococcus_pyrenoidosus.AAC.1